MRGSRGSWNCFLRNQIFITPHPSKGYNTSLTQESQTAFPLAQDTVSCNHSEKDLAYYFKWVQDVSQQSTISHQRAQNYFVYVEHQITEFQFNQLNHQFEKIPVLRATDHVCVLCCVLLRRTVSFTWVWKVLKSAGVGCRGVWDYWVWFLYFNPYFNISPHKLPKLKNL